MTRSSSSFLTLNLILPPFFFVIIATLVLASFGKSLGIRNLYVKVLLRIFEVDIISSIYFSVSTHFPSNAVRPHELQQHPGGGGQPVRDRGQRGRGGGRGGRWGHGPCGYPHHVMSLSLSSDHDQIGYSGPDGLRRRPPAMGEVGRKVTRDNKLETYIHID